MANQTSDFKLQTFRGLDPIRTELDNGVVLVAKQATMMPAVAINLAMRAGSSCDPAGWAGTTWLLSRVIDRGTATRSAADIAEDLDGRGITLTTSVTRHLFTVACHCLVDDFEPVVALLGDILRSPSIPEAELAVRKGEIITAIRQDEDNPAVRATESLMAMLYPDGHPYGRPTKGSVETVEALTRDRVLQLHTDRFAPGALTAVIVGDVEPSQAQDTIGRVFGGWRKPMPVSAPPPPVQPATSRRRHVIAMPGKAQADIAYGFVSIARSDPAYHAYSLMNNVFGQYALGGRLGDSIRERQGMAYYVSSVLDANVVPGPLLVRAGISPANVDRAIASIDEEIASLVRDGVTPKELDESRRFLVGSIPRALETNSAIASFLQTEEFFGLGLDYDARMPELLGSVTIDGVIAAARAVLDVDRATIVVAGPQADR
jgi:zinc protease